MSTPGSTLPATQPGGFPNSSGPTILPGGPFPVFALIDALAWQPFMWYAANQLATNGGNLYISNETHQALASFGADASSWTLIGITSGGGGPPTGAAGGDLTGSTYPNPTVATINGLPVADYTSTAAAAAAGQHLVSTGGRAYAPVNAETINPMDPEYGAKGDTVYLADGAMTASQFTLTSTSTAFVTADIGKRVIVQGAVATNVPLISTIASVAAGGATLNDAAYATVTGASVAYGTDDSTAMNLAVGAANTKYAASGVPQCVTLPNQAFMVDPLAGPALFYFGTYYVYTGIQLKSGVYLRGGGRTLITLVPAPVTITTASVTLPATGLPVVSTSRFANIGGFGAEVYVASTSGVYGFSSLAPTTITGTFGGTGTIPAGTAVAMRVYTSAIGTDGSTGASSQYLGFSGLVIDGQNVRSQVEWSNGLVMIGNTTDFDINGNLLMNGSGKCIDIFPYSGVTARRFWIRNNEITNFPGNAIALDSAGSDFEIVDNLIHDISSGAAAESLIGFAGASRFLVSRNIIRNWGTVDGLGTDGQILDNHMNNDINLTGSCTRMRISRNTIDATGSGQGILGTCTFNDLEISDNTVLCPTTASFRAIYILATSSGSGSYGLRVCDNQLDCPAGSGAYLLYVSAGTASDVKCDSNTLRNLATTGIGLQVSSTGECATANGNTVNGASMSVNYTYGTINNNNVNQPLVAFGLAVLGTGNTVTANNLKGDGSTNTTPALAVSATKCTVTANVLLSLAASGLAYPLIDSGGSNIFADNVMLVTSSNVNGPYYGPANTSVARNNKGLNPVGSFPTVTVPASGTGVSAVYYDRDFYITGASGGSVSCAIAGGVIASPTTVVVPASACVLVRVQAGQTLTPTYGGGNAPTWVVQGN